MSPVPGARTRKIVEQYEPLPRRLLQDGRVSYRARGVLGYLISLPEDWQTGATQIARESKEGRDAIETALTELEKYGYLARERVQYRSGQWGWVWLFGDNPAYVSAEMAGALRELEPELHPAWVSKNLRPFVAKHDRPARDRDDQHDAG